MKEFSNEELNKLEQVRQDFGIHIGGTACQNCGTCSGTEGCQVTTDRDYNELVDQITEIVVREMNQDK
jgi:heterodisulfide reductase subunit C